MLLKWGVLCVLVSGLIACPDPRSVGHIDNITLELQDFTSVYVASTQVSLYRNGQVIDMDYSDNLYAHYILRYNLSTPARLVILFSRTKPRAGMFTSLDLDTLEGLNADMYPILTQELNHTSSIYAALEISDAYDQTRISGNGTFYLTAISDSGELSEIEFVAGEQVAPGSGACEGQSSAYIEHTQLDEVIID